MSNTVLVGQGPEIVRIERQEWEANLAEAPLRMQPRLAFMSPRHHEIRYFVVKELPRLGRPISPAFIADNLLIPVAEVIKILKDLEEHLVFLVRNDEGDVSWAFPFTAEKTPHELAFSSGERTYAA